MQGVHHGGRFIRRFLHCCLQGRKKDSVGPWVKNEGMYGWRRKWLHLYYVGYGQEMVGRNKSSILYLLIPWSRILLEKLTGSAASQIPRIFGTRRFLTVLTSARQLSLSWANSIQSPQPPRTSWRSILILSSHLRLSLPSGLFPSGFPTRTLCTPRPSPIRLRNYAVLKVFFEECIWRTCRPCKTFNLAFSLTAIINGPSEVETHHFVYRWLYTVTS